MWVDFGGGLDNVCPFCFRGGAVSVAEKADFKVLPHEDCNGEIRFLHSTPHYPEWPFAKASHTSDELAEEVAVALVQMPASSLAAQTAKCAGWTIPQNYRPVHECLMELRLSPYENYGKVTFADVLRQYWFWVLSIVVLATLIFLFVIRASRLEERLKQSARDEAALQQAHDELEEKVAERTFDLEEANKSLQDWTNSNRCLLPPCHMSCEPRSTLLLVSVDCCCRGWPES